MFVNLSINKIVAMFRYIANNHTEIATFRCNEDALFNEANQDNYPQMFLEYPFSMNVPDLHEPNGHAMQTCDLSFIIVDRISESKSPVAQTFLEIETQIENVLTKCELIALQCINVYIDNLSDLNIDIQKCNYITLHHIFSDKTWGVRVELQIRYPSPINLCEFSRKDANLLIENVFNC
jgi:hypothetical protein